MNKKFLKRIAAFAMAATLVLGNAAIAAAADGTATGEGSNEGAKPDYPVASITLPTATTDKMYNYIIDPNGLIEETKNNTADERHYDANDFEASQSLWFFASGQAKKFMHTSDKLAVENKSAVDIKLTATAVADANYTGAVSFVTGSFTTAGKNIIISTKGSYANLDPSDATGKTLAAAQNVDGTDISGLGATKGAKVSMDLTGNEKAYRLAYIGGKYEYKMSTDSALKFSTGSFWLAGQCNTQAPTKWGNELLPKITVTWSWKVANAMYAYWGKAANSYWIGESTTEGFDTTATTITSLTFGGKDVTSGASIVAGDDGTKWVKLPWSACTAAGVPNGQSSYDIALTLGSDPERTYTIVS